MALTKKIEGSPLGPVTWVYGALPTAFLGDGVQVGDTIITQSDGAAFVVDANHALVAVGSFGAQQSGATFYVDGATGVNTNDGLSWAKPVLTITYALSLCTTNKGDKIIVRPGTYSENVSVTKNKISIIAAVPSGNSKRVVVSAAAGKALTLSQVTGFFAKGISFYAAASDAVLTDGEGSLFVDCDFRSDGGSGFVFFANTDNDFTGSGTILYNCLIRECSSATGAILSKKGGPTASDPGYGTGD